MAPPPSASLLVLLKALPTPPQPPGRPNPDGSARRGQTDQQRKTSGGAEASGGGRFQLPARQQVFEGDQVARHVTHLAVPPKIAPEISPTTQEAMLGEREESAAGRGVEESAVERAWRASERRLGMRRRKGRGGMG